MRLKRIIISLVLVPTALLLVVFIIANREMMRVNFNPFDIEDIGWSVEAPAFVFLFVFLGIGVVVGSVVTWIGQYKYRKKARQSD